MKTTPRLCAAFLILAAATIARADNLEAERVSANNQTAAGKVTAWVPEDGPNSGPDSDSDPLYAEAVMEANASDATGLGDILATAVAECPTAYNDSTYTPQCASSVGVEFSVAVNASNPPQPTGAVNVSWTTDAYNGSSIVANSGATFQIQPHPTNQSITGGVLYGLMDIIASDASTGGGASGASARVFTRAGLFSVYGEYNISGFGWELWVYYNEDEVAHLFGGAAVNLLVRTAEPVSVGAQRAVAANSESFGWAWNVGNSGEAGSSSVSASAHYEVEAGGTTTPTVWFDDGEGEVEVWSQE
jgi:hypothetical protein